MTDRLPRKPVTFSSVKIVIWDLDDAYWKGTLTEGEVHTVQEHVDAVRTLARHGILNSICSNNELNAARQRLEADGVWDYFVFPAISWDRKPQMIRWILNATRLLPQNALFVDDKRRIRAEVRESIPDLLAPIAPGEFIERFRVAFPRTAKPSDAGLRRLGEYKILEQKVSEKVALGIGPAALDESFLKDSNIRCEVFTPTAENVARVYELIARTNQLNFTKWRMTEAETANLISSPEYMCKCVRVEDRFGDYGVCGFLAQDCAGQLVHFLFSCRVLQMGIEQAVYRHVGAPKVKVAEGQPDLLLKEFFEQWCEPTWVALSSGAGRIASRKSPNCKQPLRMMMLGDCNVAGIGAFLNAHAENPALQLSFRTQTVRDHTLIDFFAHRAVLDIWLRRPPHRDSNEVLAQAPWLAPELFTPPFEESRADIYVLSLLNDYYAAEYRHKKTGMVVPYYYFQMAGEDITRETSWPTVLARAKHYTALTEPQLRRFAESFEFIGLATPASEVEHLDRWLAALPPTAHVILINAAEVSRWEKLQNTIDYVSLEHLLMQARHHAALNAAVDIFVRNNPRVRLVDVRKHMTNETQGRDLMHPNREAMVHICVDLIKEVLAINRKLADDEESVLQVEDTLWWALGMPTGATQ